MTVIKKYGYRLFEPSRGKDEVNGVVPVDIPRLDLETARRRDKLNYLPSGCR